MNQYTRQELEEAKTSLASTLSKGEKIQEGGRLQPSQKTLNDRRVNALRIALTLIEKEMESGSVEVFYHGTKANLRVGDYLTAKHNSNYGSGSVANFVYLTATMDAAVWGAELAAGEGRGRIYIVEPTGDIEDDPNLTDKKFPGNPTKSYRTCEPLRVVGEVEDWQGHAPEVLQAMLDNLAELKKQGIEAINE